MYRKFIVTTIAVLFLLTLAPSSVGAAKPPPPSPVIWLTSITIDPEDANGRTTNAPGAWSTNIADPLAQVGVVSKGKFLNIPQPTFTLGEINIPLAPGNYNFTLYGTGGNFPQNLFYGAVLFFNGQQIGPQIAVYNSNGGTGAFTVTPAGTSIMGGANGGLFFDIAPGPTLGKPKFVASDGSAVEVTQFTINALNSTVDRVSFNNIGPDGKLDMIATLHLTVTPP